MSKVRILSNVAFGQWWSERFPWDEYREGKNKGECPAALYGIA